MSDAAWGFIGLARFLLTNVAIWLIADAWWCLDHKDHLWSDRESS